MIANFISFKQSTNFQNLIKLSNNFYDQYFQFMGLENKLLLMGVV